MKAKKLKKLKIVYNYNMNNKYPSSIALFIQFQLKEGERGGYGEEEKDVQVEANDTKREKEPC